MASDHFSFLLFVQPPSCSSRCQFQRRGIIHFRGISHGIRPLLLSSFCSATFMFFEVPVPKKGNHPFPGHQPWHPTTSPFFFLFSHLHVLRGASSKEGESSISGASAMASDHFSFLLFVQPPSCSSRCQFQRRGPQERRPS